MNISKESSLLENLAFNLELVHSRCRDLIEITADYEGYREKEASISLGGNTGDLSGNSGSTALTGLVKSNVTGSRTGG